MPWQLSAATWSIVMLAAASGIRGFDVDPSTNTITLSSLAGFDNCVLDLAEIPGCLEALRQYANKHPNDAFAAGKRARMYYPSWTALPFFEIAFRKRATDAQCSDEDVLMAVIAGLSRPSSDIHSIKLASEIAATSCWESLQTDLIEALSDADVTLKSNICPLVAAKGLVVAACTPASKDVQ